VKSGSGARALPPQKLRWRCDPGTLGFETVEELPITPGIIGQDRAIQSLQLGITLRNKGYNVFVAGPSGTGRTTTVKHILETIETDRGAPPDIIYVNNFKDQDRPIPILLPAGRGQAFASDMLEFVVHLRRNLAQVYQSAEFKERKKATVTSFQEQEKQVIHELESEVQGQNFALVQIQVGPYTKPEIAPLIAGEPVQVERLESLANQEKFEKEELAKIKEKYGRLQARLEETLRKAKEIQKSLKKELLNLEQEFGQPVVTDALADLKTEYQHPDLSAYLDQVRNRILSDVREFIEDDGDESEGQKKVPIKEDERFRPFLVNLLVDNSEVDRPPVVVENSPNYRNLFGTIERVIDRSGHWRSDFLHIKAGSVLRANGGFLIIQLFDALAESGVWQALKRTLKNRQIDIQSFDPFFLLSTSAIKPEPIEVDLRVIVIGNSYSYHLLQAYDPDFHKIFKVKADFDSVIPRTEENIRRYATFIRNVTSSEGLLSLDKTGVAAVIEFGARRSAQGNKLSTLFSDVADLLRESTYWARQDDAKLVLREHVERAIRERNYRVGLPEEKMREMITEGLLRVDVEGARVGQINGLSVYELGDHRFGRPSRITAQTALGQAGIINIEREAELSGRSFNKAMLILDGLFRAKFGQEHPVSVNASIAFEQSYGEVDGDSASVAEVCALLSSLAELPLRQDLAITGSIDQNGNVQPIGGVNEKVEGFHDVCRARGLSGTQGVLIPHQNVEELMLREDVVDAVKAKRFQVYAIETVEDALELMTGVEAGVRGPDGDFPEESLYGKVAAKLARYAEAMKEYSRSDGDGDHGGGGRGMSVEEPDRGDGS
jgi:lon-related putative ATP-dependent protease